MNFSSFLYSFFSSWDCFYLDKATRWPGHYLGNFFLEYLAKDRKTKGKVRILNIELCARGFTLEGFRKDREALLKDGS